MFFDMHVCFFTKPNMVLFIFCFIVIAYLLPSVFTLPLTLFIYNVKTKIDALKWLVTMSLVHPVSSQCDISSRVHFVSAAFLFFTRYMP